MDHLKLGSKKKKNYLGSHLSTMSPKCHINSYPKVNALLLKEFDCPLQILLTWFCVADCIIYLYGLIQYYCFLPPFIQSRILRNKHFD